MHRLTFAMLVTVALALPVAVAAADIDVTPNASYVGITIGNKDRGVEEIIFFAGLHEISGQAAVCGFVINQARSGALRQAERQVARQLRFFIGKQRLIVQTDNFNRVASVEAARSGKAGCSITRTPWQSSFANTKLTIPAGNVRYRD